jgi:hypothetical protein
VLVDLSDPRHALLSRNLQHTFGWSQEFAQLVYDSDVVEISDDSHEQKTREP